MSDVMKRVVTESRVEFVLPNPTNWAELGKATAWAEQELATRGISSGFDDSVHVRADEEEIVLWFKIEESAAGLRSENPQ